MARASATVVLVAHRLSTVRNADCIAVLGEAGVVTERGTHDELVARDGVYAALVRRQLQTSANQITEAQVDAAAQEVEVEAAIDELTPVRATDAPEAGVMYYVVKLAVTTRSVPGARPALPRERRASGHVQRRGTAGVAPREHVRYFFVLFARIREPTPGRGRRAWHQSVCAMTWALACGGAFSSGIAPTSALV